jgi:hypothetical protein
MHAFNTSLKSKSYLNYLYLAFKLGVEEGQIHRPSRGSNFFEDSFSRLSESNRSRKSYTIT